MKNVCLVTSLMFACVLGLGGCSSSDSNSGGGTGGAGTTGATGGSSNGGSGSATVSCDVESWVGGSAPCAATWSTCTDGKTYSVECTDAACACKVDAATTKSIDIGSLCSPKDSDVALPALKAACGFSL